MPLSTADLLSNPAVEVYAVDEAGRPAQLRFHERVELDTAVGPLVPFHDDSRDDQRRPNPKPAVCLHPNGQIASLPLENRTPITTPLGVVEVELVTFYENGALKRIFPLNGKLTGFWSEADEARLAKAIPMPLPGGTTALIKPLNCLFYPSGALKAITLWPGDSVEIETPLGKAQARVGVAFHESGALASFEPTAPWKVETPIGRIAAYDPDPEGVCGDVNSIGFFPDGAISHLTSVDDRVFATGPDGKTVEFKPVRTPCRCSEDGEDHLLPVFVTFADGEVRFAQGSVGASGAFPKPIAAYPLGNSRFEIKSTEKLRPMLPLYSCKK